jgi:hypothetical protein
VRFHLNDILLDVGSHLVPGFARMDVGAIGEMRMAGQGEHHGIKRAMNERGSGYGVAQWTAGQGLHGLHEPRNHFQCPEAVSR